MKVLHIIRSMDPVRGGMAAGIRQITPALFELGVYTSVLSLDKPNSPWFNSNRYSSLGLGPVAGEYGYRQGLPRRIFSLASEHDVVIIHGIWHHHSFATWRALHRSSIPYYVYPHGMLDPWFKHKFPMKHLKKMIYWPLTDYRVLRDAKAVLYTSERECALARESFSLYSGNDVVVGFGASSPPSSNSSTSDSFLHRFPHLRGKRQVLFVGRIDKKKGIDLLIDAFSNLVNIIPNIHLVIAGPDVGGLQSTLESQVSRLNISNDVTWTGMLDNEQKWGAYRSAELFCLPSHQENFGVAVAEALACALPVALSNSVNIFEKIYDANAGLIFEANQHSLLVCLRKWFGLDVVSKRQMSQNAIKLFEDNYTMTFAASTLLKVISKNLP